MKLRFFGVHEGGTLVADNIAEFLTFLFRSPSPTEAKLSSLWGLVVMAAIEPGYLEKKAMCSMVHLSGLILLHVVMYDDDGPYKARSFLPDGMAWETYGERLEELLKDPLFAPTEENE